MLLLRRNGTRGTWCAVNSLLIPTTILAASIVSPFHEYRWGGLLPYTVLALLFAVNIRHLSAGPGFGNTWAVVNVVNIAAGAAVILHSNLVDKLLGDYYATFYPELVSSMTALGKPVLTFGSHSCAAFFYYLFFLLNLEAFLVLRKSSNLVFAFCCIILGFALLSVTGIVLMSVATMQIVFTLVEKNWTRLLGAALLTGTVGYALVVHYKAEFRDMADLVGVVAQATMHSEVNGVSGRFSQLGTLYSTVKYIKDRPFSPVGVTYRGDLFFGDSGPVEYYLRGSIILFCSIYVGLFFFLKRNVVSLRHAIVLFFTITAFEIGYSALTYVRFLCVLPILVVYLNDLSRCSMLRRNVEVVCA